MALSACCLSLPVQGDETLTPFPYPSDVMKPSWMEARKQLQMATAHAFDVYHDFKFSDEVAASGITFVNKIVADSAKLHKPVHYDHGNGIAPADVDGDGLIDLFFTNQLGSNGLWRNVGDGTFEDITTQEIALSNKVSVTASFADTDNDGDPDLFISTVRDGNHFFENDGQGRFTDQTEEAGLGYQGHSSAGVFFDYDRDGLLDLFVCNVGMYTKPDERGEGGYHVGVDDAFAGHLKPDQRNERNLLYRNEGNHRFTEISKSLGLDDVSWTGDASPIDPNRDGWPDLYILNMQGPDQFYENVRGKRFERRTAERFPKTSWGAMGIKSFDYNNDGFMDIFVTDMHSDMSEAQGPNQEKLKSAMRWPISMVGEKAASVFGNTFFQARGDGGFDEISDRIGAENYWPWGLSVGDLNADGWDDVFITASMNFPFRYGVNSVLLNSKGARFLDSEFVLGVEPRRDGRTAKPWFALDPKRKDREHGLVKDHNLAKPVEVWGAVGSRSSAIFDIENDGDLDIVTNEFHDRPMVLLSDLAAKKPIRFLKVKLQGTSSNRDGLGAVVTLVGKERTYTKVHDGATGYMSHGILPLYFGLGDDEPATKVEVRWPSGRLQEMAITEDSLKAMITIIESAEE